MLVISMGPRLFALALVALAACSSGEARGPVARDEQPRGPAPVYRCNPDRAWQPVPLGQELHCDKNGDLVCPAGNCRVEYRLTSGSGWVPDVDWHEIGSRRHPVGIYWRYTYRVTLADAPAAAVRAAH